LVPVKSKEKNYNFSNIAVFAQVSKQLQGTTTAVVPSEVDWL